MYCSVARFCAVCNELLSSNKGKESLGPADRLQTFRGMGSCCSLPWELYVLLVMILEDTSWAVLMFFKDRFGGVAHIFPTLGRVREFIGFIVYRHAGGRYGPNFQI